VFNFLIREKKGKHRHVVSKREEGKGHDLQVVLARDKEEEGTPSTSRVEKPK